MNGRLLMAALSPQDEYILKRLIKAGRIESDQAETLTEVLANHRVKKPDTSMAELLVGRRIISTKEAKRLVWEAEQKMPQTPPKKPATGDADPQPEKAAAQEDPRRRVPVRRKSRAGAYVVILVLLLGIGGGAGYLYYQDLQLKSPDPVTETAKEDRAAVGGEVVPGVSIEKTSARVDDEFEESVAESEEVPKLDVDEAEKFYFALLEEERPRHKLDGFFALLEVCPDELLDDVRRDFAASVRHYHPLVEAQLKKLSDAINRHRANLELRDVQEIYAKLLEEYGVHVLEGELKKQHDAATKQQLEMCAENERAARRAMVDEKYELARRLYVRILTYGDDDQVKRARAQLAILAEIAPDEALLTPEEIAAVKKRVAEDLERDRKARERKAKERIVRVRGKEVLTGRLGAIQARLGDLFAVEKRTINRDGIIELTYNFSAKTPSDAEDWSPPVTEAADMKKLVRWTIPREDSYEARGLKLSDRSGQTGVYFHNAPLSPPLEIQIEFRSINQFNSKNCVAACWINKKGKGVGGIYGRQLTKLKQFRPQGRKPAALAALNSQSNYKFKLEVSPDAYQTSEGSKTIGPEPIKSMTSGHVALVWGGNVNVIITKLTIKGTLDLDWAEKKLGL